MTNFTVILYISDVLKYFAVPAAAFEFLSDEKKARLEQWILKKLPSFLLYAVGFFFGISLVMTLLAYGSIFLVAGLIVIAIVGSMFSETISDYRFAVLFAALFFAAIQQWILPESWTIALAYPLEFICDMFQKVPVINSFLPDYDAEQFVTSYQNFFEKFELDFIGWLYIVKIYAFATKGLLLMIILLLDILAILFVCLIVFLVLLVPINAVVKLSDYLKKIFKINEKAVPVGAFIIWSLGETIAIIIHTYQLFQ
ncbi:hypothetical protein C8N46_103287 [Kordia periserrulae]|uniref:Uncharacterized protein n=1 Tax=Kordia periserrulae TaxID=701523 RepID=A0A2T6C1K2_9FLAO|nr:hypothetical protein [Kordia periserrulae]PTX62188.1 hypothetical protein C8N46_103287 [Kordia periserrulae]